MRLFFCSVRTENQKGHAAALASAVIRSPFGVQAPRRFPGHFAPHRCVGEQPQRLRTDCIGFVVPGQGAQGLRGQGAQGPGGFKGLG